jgi:hypothetical protein
MLDTSTLYGLCTVFYEYIHIGLWLSSALFGYNES